MIKNLSSRFLAITLTLLSLYTFSSCGSARNAATTPSLPGATTGGSGTGGSLRELYKTATSTFGQWQDVKSPVNMSLVSPKRMSFSGNLTMVRNRGLHLSVRVLGMEMASLVVVGDSVYAMSKIHRCYVAESVSGLLAGFPATVGNLQDLLLGRPFILGEGTLTPSRSDGFELEGGVSTWRVLPTSTPAGVGYGFTYVDNGMLRSLDATYGSTGSLAVGYSDFVTTVSGMAASDVTLATTLRNRRIEASVEWNFNRAKWNTGADVEWRVPSGYTRVSASDLMKILKNL